MNMNSLWIPSGTFLRMPTHAHCNCIFTLQPDEGSIRASKKWRKQMKDFHSNPSFAGPDPTDQDLDYFLLEEFVRDFLLLLLIHALSNCAISCVGFETKFLPETKIVRLVNASLKDCTVN